MDNKLKKLLSSIKSDQNFVILDVDRTIINTTSWYRAYISPDLLINDSNIQKSP